MRTILIVCLHLFYFRSIFSLVQQNDFFPPHEWQSMHCTEGWLSFLWMGLGLLIKCFPDHTSAQVITLFKGTAAHKTFVNIANNYFNCSSHKLFGVWVVRERVWNMKETSALLLSVRFMIHLSTGFMPQLVFELGHGPFALHKQHLSSSEYVVSALKTYIPSKSAFQKPCPPVR